MCIGVNFAYMEMQLVLIQTLRRMSFGLVNKEEVIPQPLITLRAAGGIKMRKI